TLTSSIYTLSLHDALPIFLPDPSSLTTSTDRLFLSDSCFSSVNFSICEDRLPQSITQRTACRHDRCQQGGLNSSLDTGRTLSSCRPFRKRSTWNSRLWRRREASQSKNS